MLNIISSFQARNKFNYLLGFSITAWTHRSLLYQLTRREIFTRYNGSMLGLAWLVVEPLLLLTIYTLFLGVLLKARMQSHIVGGPEVLHLPFFLFSGLIWYNYCAESLSKSTEIIRSHSNYVKKIIFPLELLPLVILGCGLFHLFFALLIWVLCYSLFVEAISLTGLYVIPLTFLLTTYLIGIMYVISALGAYLRDMSTLIKFFITALMFVSPIFYSLNSMAFPVKNFLLWNPLAFVIEQARLCLIEGKMLDTWAYFRYLGIGMVVSSLGFCCFQKTRIGFIDVL